MAKREIELACKRELGGKDPTEWDLFNCKELDKAPEWDGHTDEDVKRLLSLPDVIFNTLKEKEND